MVGSGPNGLVAAITLAQAGWRVTVLESAEFPGGGTRTAEVTLPGFRHDLCSSVHPLALASPVLRRLLTDVVWRHAEVPLVHPQESGRELVQYRSVSETAAQFGRLASRWQGIMGPLVRAAPGLVDIVLSPRAVPKTLPAALGTFMATSLLPASSLMRLVGPDAGALLGGSAAHSALSLRSVGSTGAGLFLAMLAHHVGWPVAEGGSGAISDSLVRHLVASGGTVECSQPVSSLRQLPESDAVLLDLTPRQVASIASSVLPTGYADRLRRYRYGPGVFKVDWALDGPVPWLGSAARSATTVHIGGSLEEIASAEELALRGQHAERPFVIFVQAGVADSRRAPSGKHTGWAYCHVPHGSTLDMSDAIERQVERYAPGFRDLILARSTSDSRAMEERNGNMVGGDILGGRTNLRQLLGRPTLSLRPWRTPVKGLYLCSSATPPGPGVHGMSGWHAARLVLQDLGGEPPRGPRLLASR